MVDGNARKIVIGDVNFHLEDPGKRDAAKFNELIISCSAAQLVSNFTHQAGHILDLFVVQDSERASTRVTVGALYQIIASFLGSLIFRSLLHKSRSSSAANMGKYAPLNLARTFVTQISQIRLGDVSAATDAYNSILHEILDKHAPEKPKTVIQRPIQKWFNDELRSTKRRRRKAERKWRDSDNSIDLHQDYKSVKYEFESLIKSTKTEYYNAAITQCGSDSKSVQKVVDE